MPVRQRRQVCVGRGEPARAWLLHARSGSPGVDADVTALVLAASGRSASVPSHDRTDPSATRSVRACGEERDCQPAQIETCLRASAGARGGNSRGPICPTAAAVVSGSGLRSWLLGEVSIESRASQGSGLFLRRVVLPLAERAFF